MRLLIFLLSSFNKAGSRGWTANGGEKKYARRAVGRDFFGSVLQCAAAQTIHNSNLEEGR